METHRNHVKPHTCTHAHTCKPRLLKHFWGKILGRSSKIAKIILGGKSWSAHPRLPKHFFCKKTGALGTEVHKLGVLALCWGNWARELGEPAPRLRGNRSPGDGGTGRSGNPIRSLFLTVRTPRQAWLGKNRCPDF